MPELPHTPALAMAPDWVCEVLSPATAAIDRAEKIPIFGHHNVVHFWLVDPIAETVEAYRLGGEGYLLLGGWRGQDEVRIAPFDAIPLELGALWSR